jgi:hypothetical protein
MTRTGTTFRLFIVAGAAAAALASSSSSSNRAPTAPASYGDEAPPQSQPMDATRALGLWKSNFGPVKIESDPEGGPGALRGVWVYEKNGAQVIGSFAGMLDGNVLQFRWMEPGPPDISGDGYLEFEVAGRTFNGRWWTANRDRGGDWQGWRQDAAGPEGGPPAGEPGPPDDGMGPAEQAPPPGDPPPPASESI